MKTGIPFRLLQTSAILLMASMVTNSVRAEKAHRVIAEGQARVVDGDTLVVGGKEITLYGIDAP